MMASVGSYQYGTNDRRRVVMRIVGAIAVFLVTIPLAIVFPILTLVSVILFVGFSLRSSAIATGSAIAVVLGIFGWMNSTKGISGDWAWYTQHFIWLQHLDFSQYWGQRIGVFTIKTTEPTYYFIASVISKLSGGSVPALAWSVSALIYIPLGVSVGLILAKMTKVPMHVGVATLIALMAGVTFTLTTQLVRQEVASALLVLGFVLFYFEVRVIGLLLAVLGVLSHNSALAPFIVVIAAYWFTTSGERLVWKKVFFLSGAFIAIGVAYLLVGPGLNYYESRESVGEISVVVVLMDVSILSIFLFVRSRLDAPKRLLNVLAAAAIVYAGFLVGMSLAPTPFLRMYFYVELFRTLMIGVIVCALLRLRFGVIFAVPILLLAVVYVEMRIRVSPFSFGGGFISHMLRPFAFFN